MADSVQGRSDRLQLGLMAALVVATLVAAWLFVGWVGATGDNLERERILALARTAAATLEADRIAALKGTPADVGSADFDAVRAELRRVREVNADFRFVYLMRPDVAAPDWLIFLADAEDADSEDYSAPGDVYDGPSATLLQVFRTGSPVVEPPSRDRWGWWVTSIAPVNDGAGRIVAILGMDVRADAWLATQSRYRGYALTLCALVLLLEALFVVVWRLGQRNADRLAALNRQLALKLQELEGAQAGMRMADVAVRHRSEAIVVTDAGLRVLSGNPAFERLTGWSGAALLGQPLPIFAAEPDSMQELRAGLQTGSHWHGRLWARRANGERMAIDLGVDAVHDLAGSLQYQILVFVDVDPGQALAEN